jgi:hypothetical protein
MANLIEIDDYKLLQNITSSDQDFVLTNLVESVSQLVKTYTNNSILDNFETSSGKAAKVEEFSINYEEDYVQLTGTPVVVDRTLSGGNQLKPIVVQERKSLSSSYTTLVEFSDFYFDSSTDCIHRTSVGSTTCKSLARGFGAVKVTYFCGYAATPADLRLAVMDLITYYFKDQNIRSRTMSGSSITNNSTTSQKGNVGFPDHIKRVLDLYKIY